jgi:hypothetical protein
MRRIRVLRTDVAHNALAALRPFATHSHPNIREARLGAPTPHRRLDRHATVVRLAKIPRASSQQERVLQLADDDAPMRIGALAQTSDRSVYARPRDSVVTAFLARATGVVYVDDQRLLHATARKGPMADDPVGSAVVL